MENFDVPEILRFNNGSNVENTADFEQRREEIKNILFENIYGVMPKKPEHIEFKELSSVNDAFAGKITRKDIEITVTIDGKSFSFLVREALPNGVKNPKAFLLINFRPDIPDLYYPTEEIADRGYAVYDLYMNEVTTDDGDFSNGIAPLFLPNGERSKNAPGKIAMWAWAAQRVMDYIEYENVVNTKRVAVIGHSRLGKTALLTGALDSRFYCTISNDSGCAGAALERGKGGERVRDITRNFPYWFCPKYEEYAENPEAMPFDQHFLLALVSPRRLYIASAESDDWACPRAEKASLQLAEPVYKLFGAENNTRYHMRAGTHFLSRTDWNKFMDFMDEN